MKIRESALGALTVAAIALAGSAYANPNDGEGGQGEAEQQVRAAEHNYLSYLRSQGVSSATISDAQAVKEGNDACGTLAGGLGGGEPGAIGEWMAGGRFDRAQATAIVHGAHMYFCPGVVAH